MKYYLAYGSNLNKAQMGFRCPEATAIGTAEIPDYGLVFRRGVLTIEPKPGTSVPVGIWKITDKDEKALDRYEGYPKFYIKKWMEVMDRKTGKKRHSMVYVMTEGHPISEPSPAYFETVLDGYKDFEFSVSERERLFEACIESQMHGNAYGRY